MYNLEICSSEGDLKTGPSNANKDLTFIPNFKIKRKSKIKL